MSAIAMRAINAAGLGPVLEARRARDIDAVRARLEALEGADLLAVGALADLIRADEVGDVVRVYANAAPEATTGAVRVAGSREGDAPGMRFLRAVALARISGPIAARVQVDWSDVGIELAQVALGFGASELAGSIANKRGLVIAEDAAKKVKGEGMVSLQRLKTEEIAGLVRRCGRRPVLVGPKGVERDADAEERA